VTTSARKKLVIVIVGVLALALIARYVWKLTRPRTGEITDARIVSIDVPKRMAQVEFIHPRSGRPLTLSGTVPEGCEITIDGAPARIEDLRVGDVAAVRGTVYADRSVRPEWVRVTRARPTSATTGPTTTSATAPAR
jgi:hypothetical protein